MNFIREQGVVGLAVGFVLGTAVARVVSALVTDIFNPLIGILLGRVNLDQLSASVGSAQIRYGDFISVLIDFIVVALVVYYIVKWLGLDKLDKKKEQANENR